MCNNDNYGSGCGCNSGSSYGNNSRNSYGSSYGSESSCGNSCARNCNWNDGCNVNQCNNMSNDCGPNPMTANINQAARNNTDFRNTFWTGNHLQITLMCIPVGSCIGLEMHQDTDQFIYIVQGEALVQLGETQCPNRVACNNAILVPAGTWHNVINIGNTPLKLYSIYAPPHHPRGTLHRTKCDAERNVY